MRGVRHGEQSLQPDLHRESLLPSFLSPTFSFCLGVLYVRDADASHPQVVVVIVFWAVSLPSSFLTILKVGLAEGYGKPVPISSEDPSIADSDSASLDDKCDSDEVASDKV